MSTSPPDPGPRICIAVLTFHRPDRLRTLLPLLLDNTRQVRAELGHDVDVLVVDNDANGSGRVAVEEAGDQQVRYVVEEQRGISYGRNRALDEAGAHDALVFIDDDETPEDGWLVALVSAWRQHGADAVAGPVVSEPDGDLDPFVEAGGFLDRAHRRGLSTGDRIDRAATNNLLLDLGHVRAHGLRFDWRFGITGGGDSLFTSQLTRSGGRMIWCTEAVVVDHVPADRMTPQWILSRSFNMASALVFVELALRGTRAERAAFRCRTVVKEAVRLLQGLLLLALAAVTRSLRHRARGRRAVARATGAFSGLRGRRSIHYPDPTRAGSS